MVWQISTFVYNSKKRTRNRIIDLIEANVNLYRANIRTELKKIERKKIQEVEAEEVIELERPESWSWVVENTTRLGERFAETKQID
jgi:hypothetical protein